MACYYIVISSTRLRNGHFRSIKGVFRGPLGRNGNQYLDRTGAEQSVAIALEELKANFYCQLCDKQYRNQQEFDNHSNSYDHTHKQRLKELKHREFARNVASRSRRQDRKREHAVHRLNKLAERSRELPSAPGSGPMFRSTTVAVEGCCGGAPIGGTQVAPTQSSPWPLPDWGRKQIHRQKVAFSFSLPKKPMVQLEPSAAVFCQTGQEGAPQQDFTLSRKRTCTGVRTSSPQVIKTGPSSGDQAVGLEHSHKVDYIHIHRSLGSPPEAHSGSPLTSPAPSTTPSPLPPPFLSPTFDPCMLLVCSQDEVPPCVSQQPPLPLQVTAGDCGLNKENNLVNGLTMKCRVKGTEDTMLGPNINREQLEESRPFLMESILINNSAVSTEISRKCVSEKVSAAGQDPRPNNKSKQAFYSVWSRNGSTVLPWPSEMLAFTRTQPTLSYSCNPLHFDFRTCRGRRQVKTGQAEEEPSRGVSVFSEEEASGIPNPENHRRVIDPIQWEDSNDAQEDKWQGKKAPRGGQRRKHRSQRWARMKRRRTTRKRAHCAEEDRQEGSTCNQQHQLSNQVQSQKSEKQEELQEPHPHSHPTENSTETQAGAPALSQGEHREQGGFTGRGYYSTRTPALDSSQWVPECSLKRLHRPSGEQQEQSAKWQAWSCCLSSDSDMSSEKRKPGSVMSICSGRSWKKRTRETPALIAIDTRQEENYSEEMARKECGAEGVPGSTLSLDVSELLSHTTEHQTQSILDRDGGSVGMIGQLTHLHCNAEDTREHPSAEIMNINPMGHTQVENDNKDIKAGLFGIATITEDSVSSVVDIQCCQYNTQKAKEHQSESMSLEKPSKQSSSSQDSKDYVDPKLGQEALELRNSPFYASPVGGVGRHLPHLQLNGQVLSQQQRLFPTKRKRVLQGPPVPMASSLLSPVSVAPPISSITIFQHHPALLPPRPPLIAQVIPLIRVSHATPPFVPLLAAPTGRLHPVTMALHAVPRPTILHPLLHPSAAMVPLQPLFQPPNTFIMSHDCLPQVTPQGM